MLQAPGGTPFAADHGQGGEQAEAVAPQADEWFYKDPAGNIQVSGSRQPCSARTSAIVTCIQLGSNAIGGGGGQPAEGIPTVSFASNSP